MSAACRTGREMKVEVCVDLIVNVVQRQPIGLEISSLCHDIPLTDGLTLLSEQTLIFLYLGRLSSD